MKTITKITYPGFALLALACFALSPTAQAGRPHPSPTPSATPTPPPAGGGFPNGIREFTASNTFVVPDGVNKLLVEVWGAGGGAGGTSSEPISGHGTYNLGGQGSAGAYTRGVLNVVPGTTINVIVGIAGSGGQIASNGGDGGSSSVNNGSSSITSGGGHGGTAGNSSGPGPGADGAPATPDPNWFGKASAESWSYTYTGDWGFPSPPIFWVRNIDLPFIGTVHPHGGFGASAGTKYGGGSGQDSVASPGGPGTDGYVFITY